jgi:hypothetical protein
MLADDFDDMIVEEAGGQRMQDLIDASAAATLFSELDIPIKSLTKSLASAPWDKG